MEPRSTEQSSNQPKSRRRLPLKLSKRWLVIGATGVILIGGGIWYWQDSQTIIDRSIVDDANFAVYGPKASPVGYQLDEDQTKFDRGILSYKFEDTTDNSDMTVSIQARPAGFDMSSISKGGSLSSTATNRGTLYDLSVGGASQYLLDTGDSLIYITSKGKLSTETINQFVSKLKPIN